VGQGPVPPHHAGSHLDRGVGQPTEHALQIPGVSNAWTMPIKARIDMLTTGIRTPVGLKISGADLKAIEEVGAQIEALLPLVRARGASSPSGPAPASSWISPGTASAGPVRPEH